MAETATEARPKKQGRVKKFFGDFKAFITKGNIIDLAVAVVIGGAFNKIVSGFVNDIIMPLLGLVMGQVSLKDLKWVIRAASEGTDGAAGVPELALTYGAFLQNVLDFVIIGFCIFVALKILMSAKKMSEAFGENVKKLSKEQRKRIKRHMKEHGELTEELKQEIETAVTVEATKDAAPAVKVETQEDLLRDIRDLLRTMQPPDLLQQEDSCPQQE